MAMHRHLSGLFCLIVVACGGQAAPPETAHQDVEQVKSEDSESAEPKKSGAYSEVATDREDIVAAAERAVVLLRAKTGDESLELVRVEHAEMQVVAGRNTRLKLALKTTDGERNATVTLYRDLKGQESLTQVEGL